MPSTLFNPTSPSKPMTRQHVYSGSIFEDQIGYARAVVQGPFVFVSGTTGFDYQTMTIEEDVEAQTRQCLENIAQALNQVDASIEDIIQITYILPNKNDFKDCWSVLREHFHTIRPAATMFEANLLDPRMKIEIQVMAMKRTTSGI